MTSRLIKYGELTSQQLVAIEFLVAKRGSNMTYEEIAQAVGVTRRTLERWRKLPEFQDEMRRRSLELMGERLPDVLDVLTKNALRGSNKSIELYLKALGLLTVDVDITARTGPPKEEDRRSNEAIDAEIRALEEELGYLENTDNEEEENKNE